MFGSDPVGRGSVVLTDSFALPLVKWKESHVVDLLARLGLVEYSSQFRENCVDGKTLAAIVEAPDWESNLSLLGLVDQDSRNLIKQEVEKIRQ
jgi:hypothetical protein